MKRWAAGLIVILLGIIVACGGEATPAPAPAQPTPDIGALVQNAVTAGLSQLPEGLDAEDIQGLVESAISDQPGISAAEVQAAIKVALAAAEPGVTSEEVQAAVTAALKTVPGSLEIQSLVFKALKDAPGLTASDVQGLVEDAIASQVKPGASLAQVQAAIDAAVGALEPGVTPAEVQAAIASALATVATPVPTAAPVATAAPAASVEPSGTLEVGFASLGSPGYNLSELGSQANWIENITTNESLFATSPKGDVIPVLVTDWSVDSTGLIYTFNLQEGAMWHDNWGEFTASDFIWSIQNGTREATVHPVGGQMRRIYNCDGCTMTAVTDYQVRLDRPSPSFEITWYVRPPGGSMTMHSKLHYEFAGEEAANKQSIGTGPWQATEARVEEFRKYSAVRNHWRKTPAFDELIFWDIGEEATRLANFLVGRIDTGAFNMESIQAIKDEAPTGVKLMSFPGAFYQYLSIGGGQYYTDAAAHTGENPKRPIGSKASELCKIAYVSCNEARTEFVRDITSAEWDKALKVRQAMTYAIDRDKLVNGVAKGEGSPWYLSFWLGYEGRMEQFGLDKLKWDFDPSRSKELLAEAGYPDGVTIKLALVPECAGCIDNAQAVAGMWEDVGILTEQREWTHGAWRTLRVARTADSAWPNSGSVTVSPLRGYQGFWFSGSSYNHGWEHPDFEAITRRAQSTFDEEDHWAVLAELARWNFDQVMHLPLYQQNSVWPISAKLDPWEPMAGGFKLLSNWEYAPHRQ